MLNHSEPKPLYCSKGWQQPTVNQEPQPKPQSQQPHPEPVIQKPSRLFQFLLLLGGAFLSVATLFCVEQCTGMCPFTYGFEPVPNHAPPLQPIQENVFLPIEEIKPLIKQDEFDADIEDEYLSPEQCAELENPELYEEDGPNGD